MRVAICDDEKIFLDQMEYLLRRISNIRSIDKYDNIEKLDKCLETNAYDLIFMDIEWKGHTENGTKYAAAINEKYPHIQIVFITAYNDRFSQSIFFEKVNLCGYLVKPIKYSNLQFLVEKACTLMKKRQEEKIVVQYKGITETIAFSDIMYLESKAHQLFISTITDRILIYKKLDDYEGVLGDSFVRIHKSFLVNMNYIKRIERTSLTLKNGTVLPISKTKYPVAKDNFFKYMSEQL